MADAQLEKLQEFQAAMKLSPRRATQIERERRPVTNDSGGSCGGETRQEDDPQNTGL